MKFPRIIPFAEALGFELLRFEDGQAEIAVELRAEQTNYWAVAHGGVLMTLLDVVMAHAARSPGSRADQDVSGVVTIEMKTSFMRPGKGRLVGKARLLHRSASLAFCEGSVFDAQGQLVAASSGTFKYLKGLSADGRRAGRVGASDDDKESTI
ncbi:MAG: PaaI family thioesterase [Burkholderiaceae bacterium]